MRLLCFALLLLVPVIAPAQDRPRGKPPMGEKVSASGTIKGIAPGSLHVVSSSGDQWLVALDPKAEVIVTGTASPSFLRPGMLVKFSGKFNKRAESVEPLSSVIVFTPRPVKQRPGEEEGQLGNEAAKGLFQLDDPAADKKKPVESFDVSSGGSIISARGGKLSVRSPQGTFKIKLADDAEVALDVSDYRLARPGDKVELEGWTYRGDVTKVVANRITIRLAEPLGEKKKETVKPKSE